MAWDPFAPLRPPRLRLRRRKLFVSYHHKDQAYRDEFDRRFNHLFINKSVCAGEIETDLSAEYVDRLIREEYITDASVIVVLVGPQTHCRKHCDWEVAAGLSTRAGGRSGLFGLLLPNHPSYLNVQYDPALIPPRLLANLRTGYAEVHNWTTSEREIIWGVNRAFERKDDPHIKSDNSLPQFTYNKCG